MAEKSRSQNIAIGILIGLIIMFFIAQLFLVPMAQNSYLKSRRITMYDLYYKRFNEETTFTIYETDSIGADYIDCEIRFKENFPRYADAFIDIDFFCELDSVRVIDENSQAECTCYYGL